MASENLMVLLTVALTVLTLIITGLTLFMVYLVYKQLRVQNASERRSRERDLPKIKLSARMHRMGHAFSVDLVELSIANDGLVDVEIHSFAFEVGALQEGSPGEPTAEIHLEPNKPAHGPKVTLMSLPHLLRPAESFSVFFDRHRLVEKAAKLGGDVPVPLRPFCHDSRGQKHCMDRWITYESDHHTSFGFSVGVGRLCQEDFDRLTPEERDLYHGWGASHVP